MVMCMILSGEWILTPWDDHPIYGQLAGSRRLELIHEWLTGTRRRPSLVALTVAGDIVVGRSTVRVNNGYICLTSMRIMRLSIIQSGL